MYDDPFEEIDIESERRKWEFRYNSQNKTIKTLEETITGLRKKIRELKNEDIS